MSWLDALLVGLAQAVAIAPGISRSGVTIGAGLILGVKRSSAARFSFLLMVPATLGAGILSLIELASEGMLVSDLPLLAIGFLAAAISGYLAIRWLLVYLTRRPMTIFALYCASVGLGGLLLSVLRG
jgi:undecaprenyl-diphosphatase